MSIQIHVQCLHYYQNIDVWYVILSSFFKINIFDVINVDCQLTDNVDTFMSMTLICNFFNI